MSCRKPLHSDKGTVPRSPIQKYTPDKVNVPQFATPKYTPESAISSPMPQSAIPSPLPVNEEENSASSDENDESEDRVAPASDTDSEPEDDSLLNSQSGNTSTTTIRQRLFYTPECYRPPSVPQSQDTKIQKTQPSKSSTVKQSFFNSKFACAIALILLLIVYLLSKQNTQESQETQTRKQCGFETLRQQKPLQTSAVWDALTINIELLLNKETESPNVYLMLYSKQSNESQIQKLIKDIALETSKCFDGQQPVEMGLQDFETKDNDDYGHPIEQYKKKLKEGSVFLIVNLNDIPPNAARALHTICDTHSPIAPDVVIFLTLHTHHKTDGATPPNLAFKMLRELWHEVPENELDALITRVIDQVLLLQG